MKLEQILELIKAVSDSNITTFKYEEENMKVLIRTGEDKKDTFVSHEVVGSLKEVAVPTQTIISESFEKEEIYPQGNVVSCPLVGTFYEAPSEEAGPFVQVGDKVKKGQTLAIVEAMKLMNEIESEFEGEVVDILVTNTQAVEYGQPLFIIR